MGKNTGNSWLNAVKKAFRSPANDDHEQEEKDKKRGRKRWMFRRHFPMETIIQHNVTKSASSHAVNGEENLVREQLKVENCIYEQRSAIALAMATTAAAEAAVATAQAAVEIIGLSTSSLLVKQHKAAVVIQTTFRGYLARRALLALKGVVKLQALIRGHNVRKRAKMTLQCIQSLVRVQALVCDQRRRLSCSIISQDYSSRKSTSRSNQFAVEEIQVLTEKAKECYLKQRKTLAHALSEQMWTVDEDRFSDELEEERRCSDRKAIDSWFRKDGNLCNQRDTSKPYNLFTSPNSSKSRNQYLDSMFISSPLHGKHLNLSVNSPKTPSSSKIKSTETNYQTPDRQTSYFNRMSVSENSCPLPRPNYMAATASAIARVRSHSTPRQRASSTRSEQTGSAKKRLSFPMHDGDDDTLRCRGAFVSQFDDEQRLNKPYYETE